MRNTLQFLHVDSWIVCIIIFPHVIYCVILCNIFWPMQSILVHTVYLGSGDPSCMYEAVGILMSFSFCDIPYTVRVSTNIQLQVMAISYISSSVPFVINRSPCYYKSIVNSFNPYITLFVLGVCVCSFVCLFVGKVKILIYSWNTEIQMPTFT